MKNIYIIIIFIIIIIIIKILNTFFKILKFDMYIYNIT